MKKFILILALIAVVITFIWLMIAISNEVGMQIRESYQIVLVRPQ